MDKVMRADAETSVLVPELWSSNFYETLLASLPWNSVVSRDYEGEISNIGDTVKISTVPEFGDATVLDEAGKNDADSVTVTQQSLVIDQRVAKDFIVTNLAQLQSLPFVEKLKEMAIYAIMKKMQAIIIAAVIPSASAPDHQIAFDSSTTLGLADLLEGKELLDASDVPAQGRHGMLGSAQLNDIFNITGFTSSDFLLAGSPLQSGEIPQQLLGFMPHYTSVQGNVVHLFQESFMTVAVQQGMSVKEYDLGVEGKRASRINCDVLFGLKQLDNKRVVQIG